MRKVTAIGTITTSDGEFFYTKRVDTRIGKKSSFWPFSRKSDFLFIVTSTQPFILNGDEVYGRLDVIHPIGTCVIKKFSQPIEILVEDRIKRMEESLCTL